MLSLVQSVNFGSNRANLTGTSGVGYTILDTVGSVIVARTTSGVYQVAPGVYSALVNYPDRFHGQIVWDCPSTGSLSASYAAEEQNVEANDPRVSDTWQMVNSMTGTLSSLYDVSYGRWKIDKNTNQMIFYKADNLTEVARFNLYDDTGTGSSTTVLERQRV